MSIYGSVLFERKHEEVFKGMKEQDTLRKVAIFKQKHFLKDYYEDHSSLFYKTVYEVELEDIHDALVDMNAVRKPSRKTCRLRDFLWKILYSKYHDHTDAYHVPDRDQTYRLGKMEIFR